MTSALTNFVVSAVLGRPTNTKVPPRRTPSSHLSCSWVWPTASRTTSAPRPSVSRITLSTAASSATTKSVAPRSSDICLLDNSRSMAMICSAPAILAPMIALRPTPPAPTTATLSPGEILPRCKAAPTPVATAQPTMAATSYGTAESMT